MSKQSWTQNVAGWVFWLVGVIWFIFPVILWSLGYVYDSLTMAYQATEKTPWDDGVAIFLGLGIAWAVGEWIYSSIRRTPTNALTMNVVFNSVYFGIASVLFGIGLAQDEGPAWLDFLLVFVTGLVLIITIILSLNNAHQKPVFQSEESA